MKYKIGDRVKIRSWSSMEAEYGLNKYGDIKVRCLVYKIFNIRMQQYCEKTVTIKKTKSDSYKIEEDKYQWYWIDDMIDHDATRILSIIYRLEMLKKSPISIAQEFNIDFDIEILKSNKPKFNIDDVIYYNNMFRRIKGETK